jgi:hypothetical protein
MTELTIDRHASLDEAIRTRARRRGLTGSLTGMRYANSYLFADGSARNALYVGVGHGLDALLALADGHVDRAIGVDPFIAEHGNDEDDQATLARLIADLGLAGRFVLHKGIIQDYRPASDDAPDMVVISDVLHHIFETPEPLRRSALYPKAAALFRHLREIAAPDARLVIGDVSRTGLRPLLGRIGLHQTYIDWNTKQNWREWDAAITLAGWRRVRLDDYIPHRLGGLKGRLPGAVLRYTLCNRYVMTYRSS